MQAENKETNRECDNEHSYGSSLFDAPSLNDVHSEEDDFLNLPQPDETQLHGLVQLNLTDSNQSTGDDQKTNSTPQK